MSTDMPRINAHIPDELLQRLKAHSKATGAPVSEIVRRVLDRYLPKEESFDEPIR